MKTASTFIVTALACALLLDPAMPVAAQTPTATPAPAGIIGTPTGKGQWPAVVESRADLSTHTIYRPASLPAGALPLLIWGNGGCSSNGLAHRNFLQEIASHGYFVISLGQARAAGQRQAPPAAAPAPTAATRGAAAASPAQDETDVAQMTQAIDWATSMTRQSGNALFGHIDVSRIAIAGHSCGGLQALKVSADPRISTSMIFDSGIYVKPGGRSGVKIDKGALASLHGPIAYFTGGPTDIAHPNTVDDVARINHVPVFFGWLPVGHGGTFAASDGGDWATAAVRWMDWQLKGDAEAGRWFSGATCLFCQDSRWKVERFVTR